MKTATLGLIVILTLGILLAPPAADAQQAGKIPRIGVLFTFSLEFPLAGRIG